MLQFLSKDDIKIMRKAASEENPVGGNSKIFEPVYKLKTGRPADAAAGLVHMMCIEKIHDKYHHRIRKGTEGMQEEVDEFASHPEFAEDQNVKEVKALLKYIRYDETSEKKYDNGIRDLGRSKMKLADFMQDSRVKTAKLSEAEVVAMRLYTTIAYLFMNGPLRDDTRYQQQQPCLLPVTTHFASEGVRKLRALFAPKVSSSEVNLETAEIALVVQQTAHGRQSKPQSQPSFGSGKTVLWRGMRNLDIADGFMEHGGTEKAFMSTTTDLKVAVRYCLSKSSLLFKIISPNFMTMGAELQWLSAFPNEKEILYPPLTYLKPTGRKQVPAQYQCCASRLLIYLK